MKYNKLSKLGFAMLLAVLFGGISWAAVNKVMEANEENVVFDDTFSDMQDANNGGYTAYTGNVASTKLDSRDGWQTLENVYQGMLCVKLGTSSKDGKMVSTPINMTGDGELMVIAAGWGTGTNKMAVSVGGATLDKAYDTDENPLDATSITVTNGTNDQASSGYAAYYFDLKDATGSVTITVSGHRLFIREVKLVSKSGEVDTRAATMLTLGDHPTTAVVDGTISLPTATVATADGAPVENATVTWTSSNEEVATIGDGVINLLTVGTTTIKAEFAGDNSYKGSSASFTLTVTKAYTSIAAMLQDVTPTKTPVTYQFENLLVTYVNNESSYVSDGNDGFLFYGFNLGLEAGDLISGTASGQLYSYNDLPELSVYTDGIKVNKVSTGNAVESVTINASELSNNVNKCISIKNVTYISIDKQSLTFTDGQTEFVAYNKWNLDVTALEAGKAYDLTGMGSVYRGTYQLYLVSFEENGAAETYEFRDIKADLTSTALIPEGTAQWADVSTGIAVAEDGTLSRIDKNGADIVFNGKWHGTQYGWANFSATVHVKGCVKITLGASNYGSGAVTVTNSEGAEVAKIDNHINAMWSLNSPDNVAVGYYRTNAETILSFSACDYLPYFAVEAIDEVYCNLRHRQQWCRGSGS